MNELEDTIRNRRSIRHLSEQSVSKYLIDKLLKAGQWAPSAGNQQPLEIIVVKDKEKMERLDEATGKQKFFLKAPVLFIICSNNKDTVNRYKERGATLYHIQDTAASIQNILLLATDLGLASCWIGAFNEDKVRAVFDIPENIRPVAILPIAHPDPNSHTPGPGRKDIGEIVFSNTYGSKYY